MAQLWIEDPKAPSPIIVFLSQTNKDGYKFITIVEVRGFLFARTTQHPISTTWFSILIVSELAEQSTKAKPTT